MSTRLVPSGVDRQFRSMGSLLIYRWCPQSGIISCSSLGVQCSSESAGTEGRCSRLRAFQGLLRKSKIKRLVNVNFASSAKICRRRERTCRSNWGFAKAGLFVSSVGHYQFNALSLSPEQVSHRIFSQGAFFFSEQVPVSSILVIRYSQQESHIK